MTHLNHIHVNYLPNDYYGSQGDQTGVNSFYTNSSAYYSPYQFNGNSALNYSWDLEYETVGSLGDTNLEKANSNVNACQLFDEIPQTNSMEFQHESYRFGTREGYEMMKFMRVELEKPKQKTSVKEYYEEFQNWRDDMLAMKSELSDQYFIDEFVHGLGWEIWMKVTRHKESPTSLNQAFLWALFEELVMERLKAAGITLIEYEGKTVIKYGAKIADPVEANDYETTQVAKVEVHEGMDKETIHGLSCELIESEGIEEFNDEVKQITELQMDNNLENTSASMKEEDVFKSCLELPALAMQVENGSSDDVNSLLEVLKADKEEFKVSVAAIIKNENLVVRIQGKYLMWDKAAPIVLGMVGYDLELPFESSDAISVHQENYRDMEIEFEGLFKQKVEAEVEYLAISRTLQKWRATVMDQFSILEEQKTDHARMLNKLGDDEVKAAILKKENFVWDPGIVFDILEDKDDLRGWICHEVLNNSFSF